jgi:hypothetical protein
LLTKEGQQHTSANSGAQRGALATALAKPIVDDKFVISYVDTHVAGGAATEQDEKQLRIEAGSARAILALINTYVTTWDEMSSTVGDRSAKRASSPAGSPAASRPGSPTNMSEDGGGGSGGGSGSGSGDIVGDDGGDGVRVRQLVGPKLKSLTHAAQDASTRAARRLRRVGDLDRAALEEAFKEAAAALENIAELAAGARRML